MSKDILRALMDPSQPDNVPWSAADLRAILDHQLSLPLVSELDTLAELAECSREEAMALVENCGCQTFGEILRTEPPSGGALRMLKDYAKRSLSEEDTVPRDVARVLYTAAILRGKQAGVVDITSLDSASVTREARRCLTFGWLPEPIRGLLRGGVHRAE